MTIRHCDTIRHNRIICQSETIQPWHNDTLRLNHIRVNDFNRHNYTIRHNHTIRLNNFNRHNYTIQHNHTIRHNLLIRHHQAIWHDDNFRLDATTWLFHRVIRHIFHVQSG
jgi:hypothetical protein